MKTKYRVLHKIIICWHKTRKSFTKHSETAEHIAMAYYKGQKNNGLKNFQRNGGRSSLGTRTHIGPSAPYHCRSLLHLEQHMPVYLSKEECVISWSLSLLPQPSSTDSCWILDNKLDKFLFWP